MGRINRIFLFFILLGTTYTLAYSQRYENSSNISIGVSLPDKLGLSLEYEKLLAQGNSYHLAVFPMSVQTKFKGYPTKGEYLDFFIGGGYKKYFKKSSSMFIPYAGASAWIGYESFLNKKDFPKTVEILRNNGFIYALSGRGGVEFNFDKISVYCEIQPLYEFREKETYINALIGIKLFIF